jgi:hypothetical protein
MGTFTLQLKEVIESLYGTSYDADDFEQTYESCTFDSVTYGKLPTLPDYTPLGLGTYPIFDEGYRKILNGKIIDEYYNQEIGTETIDNFALILRKKMDQIMPYFNQLYKSTQIEYDALDSMRIHSVGQNHMTGSETGAHNSTGDTNTTSGSRVVSSNFPQTQLAGNADYATSANDANTTSGVNSTASANSEAANNTDSNSDNLVTGYQGAASDLIVKYRNSLINIDTAILAELEDCFMLVLNNGDEYFRHQNFGVFQ